MGKVHQSQAKRHEHEVFNKVVLRVPGPVLIGHGPGRAVNGKQRENGQYKNNYPDQQITFRSRYEPVHYVCFNVNCLVLGKK